MIKKMVSVKLTSKYVGAVEPYETLKEYEDQNLILNGFVIQRELSGYSKKDIPSARVDLYFDGNDGLGQKRIDGVEAKVYKEAIKFLNRGEIHEFNRKWTAAKQEGKYDNQDPLSRKDITDSSIPPWHTDKNWMSKNKKKEYFDTPLQDVILRNDIDPKDLAGDSGLSSVYNYINGIRELPKSKAEEYAKILGKAPQTLMFDTKMITCWGNVNLQKQTVDINSNKYQPGEIRYNEEVKTVPCPAELYRPDIKAIQIDFDKSCYHGMVAYYYETNGLDPRLHNKLSMIRTFQYLKDDKGNDLDRGYYKYYLGIYQIYGNKKRILNFDATSEHKVIAEDVDVDLVATIVSFVKPAYMDQDVNIKIENVQEVGRLLRENDELQTKSQKISKEVETVMNYLKEEFYNNKKEKIKAENKIKKLVAEIDIVKNKHDELSKKALRSFEQELVEDISKLTKQVEEATSQNQQKIDLFAVNNNNLSAVEFKARKKRAN